jgi:transposase InsO family protein
VTAYRFIQANRGTRTVREMTGLLGLSAGACCRRAKYGLSMRRREADAALPRLKYGKRVSLKKAARLMRENHLNARPRRSFSRFVHFCVLIILYFISPRRPAIPRRMGTALPDWNRPDMPITAAVDAEPEPSE